MAMNVNIWEEVENRINREFDEEVLDKFRDWVILNVEARKIKLKNKELVDDE